MWRECCGPSGRGGAEDRRYGAVDIIGGGGPVGHRDPHGHLALPGRTPEPAGPFLLHRLHDGAGPGVVLPAGIQDPHEYLVEDDVVEHLDPGLSREGPGKAPGMGAAEVDEVDDA